jgi:hypothetical protein
MGWHKLFLLEKLHAGREPARAPAVSNPNRRHSHRVSAFLPAFICAHSHAEMFEQGKDC